MISGKKNMSKGSFSKTVACKILSPAFILGLSMGYSSSDQIKRVLDFVNFYRAKPAESFFHDYGYVDVIHRRNEISEVETYLRHKPSDSYVPISSNFFKENKVDKF